MISDKLYGLAFEYKKTKLWKKLWDEDLFAVKLSDGRIGYISIMGILGEYRALGLYIGEEGLDTFRSIAEADRFLMSSFEFQEEILKQDCLQCVFTGKEELTEEEREEAKKYARANGIRISGKSAYPQFVKYMPSCYPWHLETEKEQEDLCEGLAAAIEIARLLEEQTPSELGFCKVGDMDGGEAEIPLLELQDGAYALKKIKLPERKQVSWPTPSSCNEIGIASLRKVKKAGAWECEIVQFPEPVQNAPDEVPFFPFIFMAVNPDRDYILPVEPVERYRDEPERLLNQFIEALLQEGLCPKKMKVRDERTYEFAKSFCAKLKIPISIEEDLPALDEVQFEFFRHFSMSEEEAVEELVDMVGDIMKEEGLSLEDLPPELVEEFEMALQQGDLPEEIEDKINQAFHMEKKGGPKLGKSDFKTVKPKSNQSYVISVSLGTGCYRHIQISGDSSLWELHSEILDAFAFDDDHAHAFFMDNRRWSEQDCYYARGIGGGYRTTERHTLDQAGLFKGKKFLYIFDFGDEWTFQCKVLRVVEGRTEAPMVIKSKGNPPEQYPMWDDGY